MAELLEPLSAECAGQLLYSPPATRQFDCPPGSNLRIAMSSLPPVSLFPPQLKSAAPSSIDDFCPPTPLDASLDARRIVRLIQCPQCSKTLRQPVTLPCGNSLCKGCLPPTSVPLVPPDPAALSLTSTPAFKCPFATCGQEHALADCNKDVVLNKTTEVVREAINSHIKTSAAQALMTEIETTSPSPSSGASRGLDCRTLADGGRLAATYAAAEDGKLAYNSDAAYRELSGESNVDGGRLDQILMGLVKERARPELDCQVCTSILLDPLTTACGHTFCRQCVRRIIDYSNICPICRHSLGPRRDYTMSTTPSNAVLCQIIEGLCTEELVSRKLERPSAGKGECDTPLFVCTLSFPSMPTYLFIFEPRYRTMIWRAMESGHRTFGMLLANPAEPQGDLGRVHFYQYGTLLYIRNFRPLADGSGRSLVETVGLYRFRVKKHDELDGYAVGSIEQFDDISPEAERLQEEQETAPRGAARQTTQSSATLDHDTEVDGVRSTLEATSIGTDFSTYTTVELHTFCQDFVDRMRASSAPWLHRNVIESYGECPDDPSNLPWWLASIIPIAEMRKQKLLETNSVRERFKMCAGWIDEIETRNPWCVSVSACQLNCR